LKTIERGKTPSVVNLNSFNAKPIVGVKLEWVGEICLSMPKGQLERLRAKSARPRKKSK
jgi:repressor LexA